MSSVRHNPRVAALVCSGDRESCVEHLNHMGRLIEARSGQFPPESGIDFRVPLASVPCPHMSVPLTTMLERRRDDEERRIVYNNALLLHQLAVHDTHESRLRNGKTLVPKENPDAHFPFQGSNAVTRRREGDRITADNHELVGRLAHTRPTVDRQRIAANVAKHDNLVRQLSRFRPSGHEAFLGSDMIRREMGATGLPGSARRPQPLYKCSAEEASACAIQHQRFGLRDVPGPRPAGQPEWHAPSVTDVRQRHHATDRAYLRSTTTRQAPQGGTCGASSGHSARATGPAPAVEALLRHRSSIAEAMREDANFTSRSVVALHNDSAPEPPHMEFTDSEYGAGRVCSKGCFRSHHRQREAWRQAAADISEQRRLDREQFSIENQLEIQRAFRTGEEPRLTYTPRRPELSGRSAGPPPPRPAPLAAITRQRSPPLVSSPRRLLPAPPPLVAAAAPTRTPGTAHGTGSPRRDAPLSTTQAVPTAPLVPVSAPLGALVEVSAAVEPLPALSAVAATGSAGPPLPPPAGAERQGPSSRGSVRALAPGCASNIVMDPDGGVYIFENVDVRFPHGDPAY